MGHVDAQWKLFSPHLPKSRKTATRCSPDRAPLQVCSSHRHARFADMVRTQKKQRGLIPCRLTVIS